MKKVTIYTTPTCAYCHMTKEFFKKNNIQYTEKSVATDMPAQEEMIAKSGQRGVPVIDIDGDIVIGFDRQALGHLLGLDNQDNMHD